MMGVPITFYNKLNTDEYEIIDLVNDKCGFNTNIRTIINDRHLYSRLIIKNKHPVSTENTVNNNNADE